MPPKSSLRRCHRTSVACGVAAGRRGRAATPRTVLLQAGRVSLAPLVRKELCGSRHTRLGRGNPLLAPVPELPVHTRTIQLHSGGTLTLILRANIFALSPGDRAFLTEILMPLLDAYGEGGAAPQTS